MMSDTSADAVPAATAADRVAPGPGDFHPEGGAWMDQQWARQHTLGADFDPSITDAYGNARPVIEQMAADAEPEAGQ